MLKRCKKIVIVVLGISFAGSGLLFVLQNKNSNLSSLASQDVNKIKKSVVFKTVNGKKISNVKFDALCKFLNLDRSIFPVGGKVSSWNFLNEDLIQSYFLDNEIAGLIYEKFINNIVGDLSLKSESEKSYIPFKHAEIAEASLENIWDALSPKIKDGYIQLIKSEDLTTKEAFNNRIMLFLEQKNLNPLLVRNMLLNVLNEQGKKEDLPSAADLAMFGYETYSDWFGDNFVKIIGKIIINVADQARANGYTVSREEVNCEIAYITNTSYEKVKNYASDITKKQMLNNLMAGLEMDHELLIDVFQDIILFKRVVNLVSNSLFVDSLPSEKIDEFSSEAVMIREYNLPKHLMLKTEDELAEFESYLFVVSDSYEDTLVLPQETAPIGAIEGICPDIVGKYVKYEVSEVSKFDISNRIPLRKIFDQQIENLEDIITRFEFMNGVNKDNFIERIGLLNYAQKSDIDLFIKEKLIETDLTFVKEAIQVSAVDEINVFVSAKNKVYGVNERIPSDLIEAVALLALGQEEILFSKSTNKYVRVKKVLEDEEKSILSFKEVKEYGIASLIKENCKGKAILELKKSLIKKQYPELDFISARFYDFLEKSKQALSNQDIIKDTFLTKQWKLEQNDRLIRSCDLPAKEFKTLLDIDNGLISSDLESSKSLFCVKLSNEEFRVDALSNKIAKSYLQFQKFLGKELVYKFFSGIIGKIN